MSQPAVIKPSFTSLFGAAPVSIASRASHRLIGSFRLDLQRHVGLQRQSRLLRHRPLDGINRTVTSIGSLGKLLSIASVTSVGQFGAYNGIPVLDKYLAPSA